MTRKVSSMWLVACLVKALCLLSMGPFFAVKSLSDHGDGILQPEDVTVSLTIDLHSPKIVNEAMRLLLSLREFAGSMGSRSKVSICITSNDVSETTKLQKTKLVQDIHSLIPENRSHILFTSRYGLPNHAPTLNKLCSLNPPSLLESKYLLYVDSDVFFTTNPLPYYSELIRGSPDTDIFCGRPWKADPGIQGFPSFVDKEALVDSDGNQIVYFDTAMETIDYGGQTFAGMCNTGIYFMKIEVARRMYIKSHHYLQKAESYWNEELYNKGAFRVTAYVIDSTIMWASQYDLNLKVSITSLVLNYMPAIEDHLQSFSEREDCPLGFDHRDHDLCRKPVLLHFSRGSSLDFEIVRNTTRTGAHDIDRQGSKTGEANPAVLFDNSVCRLIVTAQRYIPENGSKGPLEKVLHEDLFSTAEVCERFHDFLARYPYQVDHHLPL